MTKRDDSLPTSGRERDLYERLLDCGGPNEIESLLRDALGMVRELTGARAAYLEFHDESLASRHSGWHVSHGFTGKEARDAASAISLRIIAQAIATGETVSTPAAHRDECFTQGVKDPRRRIDAVLCVPIGDAAKGGVLYLEGRITDTPFSKEDCAKAEISAHHLGLFADSLLDRLRNHSFEDPTAALRERLDLDCVVGRSPKMATLFSELEALCSSDAAVLLIGEVGCGKRLLAKVIHRNSPRAEQVFREIECGVASPELLDRELSGIQGPEGAQPANSEDRVGSADRGTLFLRDIEALRPASQQFLLEVLEAGETPRLDSSRSPRPLLGDLRIVAATTADLRDAVAAGRFREDLFQRLMARSLRVPALHERREDVAALARAFVERASERHHLPRLELSSEALRILKAAEWPGNIQQLEDAVEAGLIRAGGERAERVAAQHLFPQRSVSQSSADHDVTFQQATRAFQARFLDQALHASGWNVSETARRLGLARSHVYNLIRAFGLERYRRYGERARGAQSPSQSRTQSPKQVSTSRAERIHG